MNLSLFFAVCIFSICCFAHVPKDRRGAPIIPCLTQEHYELRHQVFPNFQDSCRQKGQCDDPVYRDSHGSNNITLQMIVHIINSDSGEAPDGVTIPVAEQMMKRVTSVFKSAGVSMQYQFRLHNDSTYYCIPGYDSQGHFADAIDSMKTKYAEDPTQYMNVFISCMEFSLQGTLYGIGTFPWDASAMTATGGLWLNGIACNTEAQQSGDATFEHEFGHCLGLWHTFHGSDEVFGCKFGCEELPHPTEDPAANLVGDFCSDTPATPRDYSCSNPTGTACDGQSWGDVDYTNYMGYGMDPTPCGNHFTAQQQARMHCWPCDALSTLVRGCN